MSTTNCQNCGALIREDPTQQMMHCKYCGTTFSTPEHDERYNNHIEQQNQQQQSANVTKALKIEEKKGVISAIVLTLGTFFVSLAGRVFFFLLGLFTLLFSLPLVFQYGFLKKFAPEIMELFQNLPLAASVYPWFLANSTKLTAQLLIALIFGTGLALIRRRLR